MHSFHFQDHVEEILRKWEAIDDEIWAKVIVLERNRRVAKVYFPKQKFRIILHVSLCCQAYARAPVLTVNGGNGGFDGYRWVIAHTIGDPLLSAGNSFNKLQPRV